MGEPAERVFNVGSPAIDGLRELLRRQGEYLEAPRAEAERLGLVLKAVPASELDREVDRVGERAVGEKRPGTDRASDAGELLVDHAPGAEVEVPDLGVPHLPDRKADAVARGIELREGVAEEVLVEPRGVRLRDGTWTATGPNLLSDSPGAPSRRRV